MVAKPSDIRSGTRQPSNENKKPGAILSFLRYGVEMFLWKKSLTILLRSNVNYLTTTPSESTLRITTYPKIATFTTARSCRIR
jgi:hypothetical protein